MSRISRIVLPLATVGLVAALYACSGDTNATGELLAPDGPAFSAHEFNSYLGVPAVQLDGYTNPQESWCNDPTVREAAPTGNTGETWLAFKQDPAAAGATYNIAGFEITISADDRFLDWSATGTNIMQAVMTKPGDLGFIYFYNPWYDDPSNGITADPAVGDMITADQDLSGRQQGISHFVICYTEMQQGTKSGIKFEDDNADGDQDAGEDPLSGWTIHAFADDNGDGVLSQSEFDAGAADSYVTEDGTGTLENGGYILTLWPGDYVVCEEAKTDWTQSAPFGAAADGDCSIDASLGPAGFAITVTSGSSEVDNDFGNWQQGTKSGIKFEDYNLDGDQDSGEDPISGWTIYAFADGDGDGVLSQGEFDAGAADSYMTEDGTGTLEDGGYLLSLDPGDYVVCEETKTGWKQSAPFGAAADGDCSIDASLGPAGFAITVTSGSSEIDNDFGNWQQGTKSGIKFEDDNADGDQDSGEDPISGWTIYAFADGDGNGVLSQGEFDAGAADSYVTEDGTGTLEDGGYLLSLDPGDYVVCEEAKTDWTQSAPFGADADGDCSVDASLGPAGFAITVTSGSSEIDNDFGNWTTATKSGTKYNDLDNDGIWDSGEPGLSGWMIDLISGGSVVASATTDADGYYEFSGLAPGTYQVCEVMQTDWVQTDPSSGFDCTTISTAYYATYGYSFTLESGASHTGNDFGNYMPPDEETAWAANTMDCCTILYNPDGGNWFTFVEYAAKTVGLYAGQTQYVGTVDFSAVQSNPVHGNRVKITVNLDGAAFADGQMIAIEAYDSDPTGSSTAPGQFTYNQITPAQAAEGYWVRAAAYYGVHAVVLVND